jgi:hypothetical protein
MRKPGVEKPDPHLEEEEPPEFTTPQGVQMEGVPYDYEKADINVPAFFKWMGSLFAATAVILVVMYLAFQVMLGREAETGRAASPMLETSQKAPPPNPRLLPNRIDFPMDEPARSNTYLPDPPQIGRAARAAENAGLAKIRLLDSQTGLPTIPADVAQRVIAGAGAPGAPTNTPDANGPTPVPMPADSSGGLNTEDRMR